jgi:hypothetical protein
MLPSAPCDTFEPGHQWEGRMAVQVWFSLANGNGVVLHGGIWRVNDPNASPPLYEVTVTGTSSTRFSLDPDVYCYEFNVTGGTKFDITVYRADNRPVTWTPHSIDTGQLNRTIDVKTYFTIT